MTRGASSGTAATDLAAGQAGRHPGRDLAGPAAGLRRARPARAPAGQHVDVRLTAEDGYRAQRSYSLASPPEQPRLQGLDLLGPHTTVTLTRGAPADWPGPTGRIDGEMLLEPAFPPAARPRVFVCGPTVFVGTVATTLVDLGHDPSSIRLERFGASGSPV